MPSRVSALLSVTLLLVSACRTSSPTVREPRRTLAPLPPRDDAAVERRERAPTWSLSTSEDLESLGSARRWNVVTTDSFRLLHLGAAQARRVADEAERRRAELVATWVGTEAARAAWRPRCEIALYVDRRQLEQMTGGDHNVGVAGARQAELTPGRMLERRIQLSADDPELFAATLPHEIGHIVMRDALHGHRPPLWANEGMAMLCESPAQQQRYRAYVVQALVAGRAMALGELLALGEYPAGERRRLFYAQSHSLATFLVDRRGPGAFIDFLRDVRRSGAPGALQRAYGFASIPALTEAWHRAATRPVAADTAASCAASKRRGRLSKEAIQRVINDEIHRVTACYERQLQTAPHLGGRIVVRFVISAAGGVCSATAASVPAGWDRGPGRAVTKCIVEAVRQLRFPAPQGGGAVEVSYPFVLRTTPSAER